MSDLDLTLIKARLARARHLPVFLTEGDIAKARENRKGLYRWHLEGTWDDAVLFGRARDDIAALVAEVERLQKENEELRKGYDLVKYGAATGPMIGLAINDAAKVLAKTEWWITRRENERLHAQLDAVRELHYPVEIEPSDTICGECSYQLPSGSYFGKVVEYPCPTISALGGEQG